MEGDRHCRLDLLILLVCIWPFIFIVVLETYPGPYLNQKGLES